MTGERDRARRRIRIEVATVLAVVLPVQLYGAIYWLVYPEQVHPGGAVARSAYLIANSVAWLALVLFVIHRSGESRNTFGLHRPFLARDLVTIAVLVLTVRFGTEVPLEECVRLLFGTDVFASTWFGGARHRGSVEPATALAVALVVLSSLANACAEETVMRGYLIPRFERLLGSPAAAVASSSLVFASYHMYQGVFGFVSVFLFGIVFGCGFVVVRRVWPLCWAHFLFDAVRSPSGETSVWASGVAFALVFAAIPLVALVRFARRQRADGGNP